jgi:hypothetical protein
LADNNISRENNTRSLLLAGAALLAFAASMLHLS